MIGYDVIRTNIISEVKEATFFSVLADDVSCHNAEHCLCFVDKSFNIRDDFVAFVKFPRVNAIISTLEELGLSLQNLRGQRYDGAATMSVEKSSVSSPPHLQKIHRRHIHHLDPQSRSIRQLPSKHHLHQTHITQRSQLFDLTRDNI